MENQIKTSINDSEIIEVVLRKFMTVKEWNENSTKLNSKGWNATAYQKGFFNTGLKQEI